MENDVAESCPECGRPLHWIKRPVVNDPTPPTADLPTYPDCTLCLEVPNDPEREQR